MAPEDGRLFAVEAVGPVDPGASDEARARRRGADADEPRRRSGIKRPTRSDAADGRPWHVGRVVRVVTDVAGIGGEFDYLVMKDDAARVDVGTMVRVVLHGRRVNGWVIAVDVAPPDGVRLLPIQAVRGHGPSAEVLDLARWASWRWASKRSFFLRAASPERLVRALPAPAARRRDAARDDGRADQAAIADRVMDHGTQPIAVLEVGPTDRGMEHVLAADDLGPSLIVVPGQRAADAIVERLRGAGRRVARYPQDWALAAAGGVSVVGTRSAVWASMPDIASAVVLDAHDEALVSEAAPTWSAVEVLRERCARRGAPLVLVSCVPRVEHLAIAPAVAAPDRERARRGWAPLHVVDLRRADPRSGMYTPRLIDLLRSERRIACVLNRKGRARLLVCSACDEVARCETCHGALRAADGAVPASVARGGADGGHGDGGLVCTRCRSGQPAVCAGCGGSQFKQLRKGVASVREELEALALRQVGEVTGDTVELPAEGVLVGTEALLHRIGRADAVVFLDFDQELLAPRYRAPEDALVLLARASRIVGGHRGGGLVVVQTRQPHHEVIEAAVLGDPSTFSVVEREHRRDIGWPPDRAMARVSGAGAALCVGQLPAALDVLGPVDDQWLVLAEDHRTLCDALASVERPPKARVRIEVDPVRA